MADLDPKTILYSPSSIHLFVPAFFAIAEKMYFKNPRIRQVLLLNEIERTLTSQELDLMEMVRRSGFIEIVSLQESAVASRPLPQNKTRPKRSVRPNTYGLVNFVRRVIRYIYRKARSVYLMVFLFPPVIKTIRWVSRVKHYYPRYRRYRDFIEMLKPDVGIFGSDQGEPENLLRIKILEQKRARVVVLSVCDLEQQRAIYFTNHLILRFLSLKVFGSLGAFLTAISWRGNVVGSFPAKTIVLTTTAQMKEKMLELTGRKSHDIIPVFLPMTPVDPVNIADAKEFLNFQDGDRILTFYTENLTPIYGVDYNKQVFEGLKPVFEELSLRGVKVCVKLHPHESTEVEEMIRALLPSPRYYVTRDLNFLAFVSLSQINMAHFSRVLIEAVQRDKVILSLDLKRDKRSFIPEKFESQLTVGNFASAEEVLKGLFFDPDKFSRYQKVNQELKKDLNGGLSLEANDVILGLLTDK